MQETLNNAEYFVWLSPSSSTGSNLIFMDRFFVTYVHMTGLSCLKSRMFVSNFGNMCIWLSLFWNAADIRFKWLYLVCSDATLWGSLLFCCFSSLQVEVVFLLFLINYSLLIEAQPLTVLWVKKWMIYLVNGSYCIIYKYPRQQPNLVLRL